MFEVRVVAGEFKGLPLLKQHKIVKEVKTQPLSFHIWWTGNLRPCRRRSRTCTGSAFTRPLDDSLDLLTLLDIC